MRLTVVRPFPLTGPRAIFKRLYMTVGELKKRLVEIPDDHPVVIGYEFQFTDIKDVFYFEGTTTLLLSDIEKEKI